MSESVSQLKVLKKLAPDQPGARKLARRYGNALVCVRHRADAKGQCRYTTVELLVETTAIQPRTDKLVKIKIDFNEGHLRTVVRAAGAKWDPKGKVWLLPRRVAGALNLLNRVVGN